MEFFDLNNPPDEKRNLEKNRTDGFELLREREKKSLDTTTFPALERELETWLDASPFTNGLIARAEFPEIYTHHTVPRYRCMEILE